MFETNNKSCKKISFKHHGTGWAKWGGLYHVFIYMVHTMSLFIFLYIWVHFDALKTEYFFSPFPKVCDKDKGLYLGAASLERGAFTFNPNIDLQLMNIQHLSNRMIDISFIISNFKKNTHTRNRQFSHILVLIIWSTFKSKWFSMYREYTILIIYMVHILQETSTLSLVYSSCTLNMWIGWFQSIFLKC